MLIQQANTSQAEAILKVQHAAFYSEAEIHNDFTIPPYTQTLESLLDDFQQYTFYIALEDNKIIGSVRVQLRDNVLYIGKLIVSPEHQNKGIGKKIMTYVEQQYAEVKSFELLTAEKSERNIYLYQKIGYRIHSKFPEPGHENVILVKLVKPNS